MVPVLGLDEMPVRGMPVRLCPVDPVGRRKLEPDEEKSPQQRRPERVSALEPLWPQHAA